MVPISEKWWLPEQDGGFFGEHYKRGDDSEEGPCSIHPMVLAERTAREVNFLLKALEPRDGQKVLDCPCGYGRHSLELSKRGMSITGVDLNPDFIKFASQKVIEEQLFSGAPVFRIGDMRSLPVDSSSFDFVINMFTSFGFFDKNDDLKVLSEFSRVLKPGGKLVIHLDYNFYRIISGSWNNENRNRHLKDGSMLQVIDEYDPEAKKINGYWQITKDNIENEFHRPYSLSLYSPSELTDMLKHCGFKNVFSYGSLDNISSPLKDEYLLV